MTHAQAQDSRVEWEGALVQRACAGDTRAFERLYREHAGRVYGLCLRMTRDVQLAEDCTQDTFINAWRVSGDVTSELAGADVDAKTVSGELRLKGHGQGGGCT
jgi:hypothetical protein